MTPYLSRALAFVGVALGLAAIWIDFGGGSSYWDSPGHSLGIAMLVLAIVAGLAVFAALLVPHPAVDRVWIVAGLPLGGLLLFIPVDIMGQGTTSQLDSGAWLGFTAFFVIAIAALVNAVTGLPAPAVTRAEPVEPPPPPPPPAP
jgi:hypothetical protein